MILVAALSLRHIGWSRRTIPEKNCAFPIYHSVGSCTTFGGSGLLKSQLLECAFTAGFCYLCWFCSVCVSQNCDCSGACCAARTPAFQDYP